VKGLIVDNYDSFTYNLFQLFGSVVEPPKVVRNDAISLDQVRDCDPDFIVLSPGPGNPENPSYFGVCAAIIRELGPRVPILGVCLGHQGIGHVLGARVVRAAEPMHGKTSLVFHNGNPLFTSVPRAFDAMRYHSLIVDPNTLPAELEVTAKTWEGTIMGIGHRAWPVWGVQFHPESIGTPHGKVIVHNFVALAAALRKHPHEGYPPAALRASPLCVGGVPSAE
jgi:anthranilate synthase component 2